MHNTMDRVPEKDCSLIIPAYNEEERIGNLLNDLIGFGGEIIIISDGTDATASIVSRFTMENPDCDITCISSPDRLGKGGGIARGMKQATRTYIGFMDADGSTSIEEMNHIFSHLDHADGVIGSRWMPESMIPIRQGMVRRVQSRIFNILIRILFGLPYADTQCGAKAFRRELIETILDTMQSTGFEFDVELLWKARNAGYEVIELPISWTDRGGSSVRMTDSIAMITGLLKVRFL